MTRCVNEVTVNLSPNCVFDVFVCFGLIPEPELSAVDSSVLKSEPDLHNGAATRRRLKTHR